MSPIGEHLGLLDGQQAGCLASFVIVAGVLNSSLLIQQVHDLGAKLAKLELGLSQVRKMAFEWKV